MCIEPSLGMKKHFSLWFETADYDSVKNSQLGSGISVTVFLTVLMVSFNVGAKCACEIFLEKYLRASTFLRGAFAPVGDFGRGH
jgi:hypothetical protein